MRRPEVPARSTSTRSASSKSTPRRSNAEQVDAELRESERARLREAQAEQAEQERELREASRQRRRAERAQARRFTAGRRRRLKAWGIGAGVVIVAIGILIALVTTPIMSVREIRVEGTDRVSEEQIVAALEGQLDKPIALVSEEEIGEALQQFTSLESYAVDLLPPSTLLIRIQERIPVAVDENGHLLDAAGVSLGEPRDGEGDLPTIVGVAADTAEFEAVASVLKNLSPFMLEHVAEITASSSQSIQLKTEGGETIVWGGPDQSRLKSDTVQALLQSDAVKGKTIDVSAPEHPVVR
ncbi:cell division protein FtsQ/DivIB [Agrococcus casei]|uniref:cell division protein FtsQ/DivIB n=1 Tax=Agrococcus casei TaxID=343512 RepID=UPI003F8F8B93